MARYSFIHRRSVILNVARDWRARYGSGHYAHDPSKQKIQRGLDALDLATCSADDVNKVIGNSSWTSLRCDACDEDANTIMRIGEEPDYEARWQDICLPCMVKLGREAAKAIEARSGQTEGLDRNGESAVGETDFP